ncbi:type IV pilus assembly protein PilM [Patescibacteria group bacterium]|nr:type IV pilus assembly protein PilM [Patescibacteria group bacterium]
MIFSKKFGLDISDNSIEVMELKKMFGKISLVSYGRTKLEGEVVKDGVIKKPEVLEKYLKEVLQQAKPKPITAKECVLSLPESKIYTHVFKMPANLDNDQIKNSLPYEAEKVIPFSTKEIFFDFKVLGKEKNQQNIFYAATEYNVIESYNQVLKKIGVKPIVFELESVSTARSLIRGKDIKSPVMVMDIGARSTNLSISYNGAIHISRIINVAGNHFTRVIAKEFGLTEEEAEKKKAKAGFDPTHEEAKIVFLLQKQFVRIIKESQEVINYFNDTTQLKVEKIILTGGSSQLPKLDEYLAENLSLPVEVGKPISGSKLKNKSVFTKQETLYANVTGLALRAASSKINNKDLNLNSIQVKKLQIVPAKTEKKQWKKIYVSAGIFILLAMFLGLLLLVIQRGMFMFKPPEFQKVNIEVDEALLEQFREGEEEKTIKQVQLPRLFISDQVQQLNVRSGPGYNFGVIDQVASGDEFDVIKEENGWYKIEISQNIEGWVVGDFVEIQ